MAATAAAEALADAELVAAELDRLQARNRFLMAENRELKGVDKKPKGGTTLTEVSTLQLQLQLAALTADNNALKVEPVSYTHLTLPTILLV